MNERIRELAFQAMAINQKVSDDAFFVEVSKLNEFEKFTELIVRECCDIVGAGGEFASRPKLVEKLQEHFGVDN